MTDETFPYTPEQLLQRFLLNIKAYMIYLESTITIDNKYVPIDIVAWWNTVATPELKKQLIAKHVLMIKNELRLQSIHYKDLMLFMKQFYHTFKGDFTQTAKEIVIKCELFQSCPSLNCLDSNIWQTYVNVANRAHYLSKVFPTILVENEVNVHQLRNTLYEWIESHYDEDELF